MTSSSSSSSAKSDASPQQPLLRTTATKLYDQAKQNTYIQYGVTKLVSLSSTLPTSVTAPVASLSAPVSAFLDRNVTVVDNTLNNAITYASSAAQQASDKKIAATAAVSSNLTALRTRIAQERQARQEQVQQAAKKVQAVVADVVEHNPVLSQTVSTTSKTINQVYEIASEKWHNALLTSKEKIDAVLPVQEGENTTNNNNNNNNNNNVNDADSLLSLSSTVLRRSRARLTSAVSSSVSSLKSVRTSVSSRIDNQRTYIMTSLSSLPSHLPLKVQTVGKSIPLSREQLSQQQAAVKTYVFNHYDSVLKSSHAFQQKSYDNAKLYLDQSKTSITNKAINVKDKVLSNEQIKHVVQVVESKTAPSIAFVSSTVTNAKGLVISNVNFVIDWSKVNLPKQYNYLNSIVAPVLLKQQPQPAPVSA